MHTDTPHIAGTSTKSLDIHRWLFLALPLIYFLLYGYYGFSDTDQGFMLGLAHRVQSGQIPYQDFLYVRPPLSPLLHSLELALLPRSLAIIGMRFIFFVTMWWTVWLSLSSLRRFFDIQTLGISPWLLGSLAYILSVHNFPPMAWHTIDGLLFGSLGIWMLTRGAGRGWLIGGLLSLGLAAMAKQPFALMFPEGVVLAVCLYGKRAALQAMAISLGIALVVAVIFEILLPGNFIFGKMLPQITGSTRVTDLLMAGVVVYGKGLLYLLLPGAAVWALLRYGLKRPDTGRITTWLVWGALIALLAGQSMLAIRAETFMPPRFGLYHAMLLLAAAAVILRRKTEDQKGLWVLGAMVVLAWTGGISWGYKVPALLALPGIFGVVYGIRHFLQERTPTFYYPAWTAAAFICFYLMYQYPYRDQPKEIQAYGLNDAFAVGNYVTTGPENSFKHMEFRALYNEFGDPYTVLPAFPHAHYLSNSLPVVPIDWAHNAELGGDAGYAWILEVFAEKSPVVFVEKDKLEEAETEGRFGARVLKYVLENGKLLRDQEFFQVYHMP